MPKVSVVIPNYNYETFLTERIDSILNQTYKDFEIIFLDDASTDTSVHLFKEIIKKTNIPYKVIVNNTNTANPFKQWNRGVDNSNGEYVWIAEADDFCDKTFLEKTVNILENNKNIGIVYTQSNHVNEKGEDLGSIIWSVEWFNTDRWKKGFINKGTEEIKHFLLFQNTIPNASAVLFRKDIFIKAGKAFEQYKLMGDWITWAKMLAISDIAFIPESLNFFRVHSKSVRSEYEKNKSIQFIKEMYNCFEIFKKLILVDSTTQEKVFDHYTKILLYKFKNGELNFLNLKLYLFILRKDIKVFFRMLKLIKNL